MSYQDERSNQIAAEMNHLMNLKKSLRNQEKSLNARAQYLANPQSFPSASIQNLEQTLKGALPPHMMPGNVGALNSVMWPFYFQVDFDLGDNPVIASNTFADEFFQVDQEAALVIQSISRSSGTDDEGFSGTMTAPLQVEFIDRQSSRRFQSEPIPLQMIGNNSKPTIFPTSFLLMPNAILDVQVSGIPTTPQTFTGSGQFEISFFGYRVRIADAGKVLSTIFATP
jgi:hypothetical protein